MYGRRSKFIIIILGYPAHLWVALFGAISTRFEACFSKLNTLWMASSVNQCSKCGRVFARKYALDRHLNERKHPCVASTTIKPPAKGGHTCLSCGREFCRPSNLTRHMSDGRCPIATPRITISAAKKGTIPASAKSEDVKKHLEKTNKILLELSKEVASMRDERKSAEPTSVINNGTVNNITINIFGNENITHLTSLDVLRMLNTLPQAKDFLTLENLLPAAQQAVINTAMLIYSDEKRPENITCYLPNKKTDEVVVRGASGWEVRPYTLIVSPIAARVIELLFAKQPIAGVDGISPDEDNERWGKLLRCIRDNETTLTSPPMRGLRPILVRNRDMLGRYLDKLPVSDKLAD
jgi:hypothetical protein